MCVTLLLITGALAWVQSLQDASELGDKYVLVRWEVRSAEALQPPTVDTIAERLLKTRICRKEREVFDGLFEREGCN